MSTHARGELPLWYTAGLVPVLNVTCAFLVAGLVVVAIGVNPITAVRILVGGALGSANGIGYTLYYATTFIFTGLAVAIAFHAGHFNIGGEGQALLGGLGIALVVLNLAFLPAPLLVLLAIAGAALAGALWAFLPGWLQAYRGSHVVITTIMFNFIAFGLLGYLLVGPLKRPDSMALETLPFIQGARFLRGDEILGWFGIAMPRTPLNLSFVLALACAFFTWVLVWHTRLGYEIRTVGANPSAAHYAGISSKRITVIVMMIGGAFAGMMATNEILGVQQRLIADFTAGAGFVGIAVALMGRGHPAGIVLASLLFGVLYQGGAELAFDIPQITRDMIVVIQGLVILFAGALENMFRDRIAGLLFRAKEPA
jgi:general nucleoside transport system permease protein